MHLTTLVQYSLFGGEVTGYLQSRGKLEILTSAFGLSTLGLVSARPFPHPSGTCGVYDFVLHFSEKLAIQLLLRIRGEKR